MSLNTKPYFGTMGGFNGSYTIAQPNVGIRTIGSTSLADAKITINGGENGNMLVNVPLLVNGIDVEQVLQDLMAVTGIVSRNKNLEEKYSGLKKAGEEYQNTLRNAQIDLNIKIKKAGDDYRLAEEKYKTFNLIKESA